MSEAASESFLDRTLGRLGAAWRDIAVATRIIGADPRPDLDHADDVARLRQQMQDCLDARGGAVSARGRAAQLGRVYLSLSPKGRHRFLSLLAEAFDTESAAVDKAVLAVQEADDPVVRSEAEAALRRALEPGRRLLLTQFNGLPEGIKFLVDLRADLLPLVREDRALKGLEEDLRALLTAWFDIGLLEMRRIDWSAPAALLEKLIAYEAVHAIRSWTDLKNRLDSDRRCFGFFHPNMPDEPLIFVEVALVKGIAGNVQALLDETAPLGDPAEADTAIFYSISNAQKGLAGISMGDFLIKRVVDALSHQLPNLKTYATLSPIPGFRRWLDREAEVADAPDARAPLKSDAIAALAGLEPDLPPMRALLALLDRTGWPSQEAVAKVLQNCLPNLAARYLLAKREGAERVIDPVAHFHLNNGARVERLNWLADPSPHGLAQSAGLMVNYLYKLDSIEENHEAYRGQGKVATSSAIRSLAKA